LITAELPSFSKESAVCTKQDQRSEYTTHSTFTKSVLMSIAVSKVVVHCRAWSEKSKDSIGRIFYYLNKC